MKSSIYKLFLWSFIIGLSTSCNDDFLQRDPHVSITSDQFFRNVQDLETYTNGFYSQMQYSFEDLGSDNISLNTGSNEVDQVLVGGVSAGNVGGWSDWSDLRRINYMLARVDDVVGSEVEINHFIGIARLFRAWFYIDKVQRYSDVPWYDVDLSDTDEELLYKEKDPREIVVDNIIADLEFAAVNVKDGTDRTRVTKYAAIALLSRFALYEGTFRKYHPELGLTGSENALLERALSAAEEVISSGAFSVYSTGSVDDYSNLFKSPNLNGNPEMIWWVDSDEKLGVGNNTHVVYNWQWSLSKDLADTYLMGDGTPFTSQTDFDKKPFVKMFADRDPRMMATIVHPGFKTTEAGDPVRTSPNFGGYLQVKYYPNESERKGWNLNYTDLPVIRYAEVLLNLAEAKAELGTLNQGDLDRTVNVLRSRVGMPALQLGIIADPYLGAQYPAISGNGTLLELRRERRVELACEGFRYSDMMRWAAGDNFNLGQEGMYFPSLGAFDVTGDGIEDIAILEKPGSEGVLSGFSEEVRNSLSKFYLLDENGTPQSFYLSEGNKGFVRFTKNKDNPPMFEGPKYYYRPIPQQQLVLNPNLEQTTFW
ncbi:RagB/SusD family nutrient uptake outer membrane protein [Algoriphagus chordae]|uniref:Putative outer membrane starch-binding protein n=1 Tax=Algoriphagus chordae TaxID=237019 RepID=A0A2W7REH0_9BACT|nr:RagB/SusD family nutrient uptake outer membrane protein [Algoriphagus chordae]PZX56770.1 putative outer membrane starch-binding protein [Algoriphagus chordae]